MFPCDTFFCHFSGRELLVPKLIIVHINNKATGMLNKFELLEAYFPEGLR